MSRLLITAVTSRGTKFTLHPLQQLTMQAVLEMITTPGAWQGEGNDFFKFAHTGMTAKH